MQSTGLFAVLALMLSTSAALAQPTLPPPPGPIDESGRWGPRIEINQNAAPGDADSIFRISAPGSYYLTSNLVGLAGKTGIEIASANVTIDLNGFTLQGVPDSLNGIGTPMDA